MIKQRKEQILLLISFANSIFVNALTKMQGIQWWEFDRFITKNDKKEINFSFFEWFIVWNNSIQSAYIKHFKINLIQWYVTPIDFRICKLINRLVNKMMNWDNSHSRSLNFYIHIILFKLRASRNYFACKSLLFFHKEQLWWLEKSVSISVGLYTLMQIKEL